MVIQAPDARAADRLQFLYSHYFHVEVYVPVQQPVIAPSSPAETSQRIPTSAYGQTIPVIFGKARVPSAYIWAKPIDVTIDDASVTVKLTARLRFARPLVANSNWRVRRMWADGKLIINRATGYTSPLIDYFAEYDGQNAQDRDPVMVEEEGEDNVSAHRGYLDVVITMQLSSRASQPPVYEAEWVQDAASAADVQPFDELTTLGTLGFPGTNWSAGISYIYSTGYIRWFSINGLLEIYRVPVSGVSVVVYSPWKYISQINRILTLTSVAGSIGPCLFDPTTGAATVIAADPCGAIGQTSANQSAIMMTSATAGVIMMASFNLYQVSIYRFSSISGADTMVRMSLTTANWGGRGVVTCMVPGALRADDFDIWVTAGDKLYKAKLTLGGAVVSITAIRTFADDPIYCVFYDSDVVVWTDGDEAIRVDGATGNIVWTQSVPYTAVSGWRGRMGEPDLHRVSQGTLLVSGSVSSYLTSLKTGTTETISAVAGYGLVWDSATLTAIGTSVFAPVRIRLDLVGNGTTRDLDDFIEAVWESDSDYSAAEHDEINITDQIQGAVIDVTSGKREVIRSIAGPYRFSIFERAGKIITKRALTDGSFAVDATIVAADIADRSGQAIKATRNNPEEFIARYGINYRDPDEIYQSRPQFGEIQFTPFPLSPTDIAVKVDVPVIMDATTIKTLATKKVHSLAEEKHNFTMQLRAKFCDLEPEDIVQFTLAGRTVYARVAETTMNPDFTIEVKCTEFLSKVEATVTGASGRPFEPGEVGAPESSYFHLDIPLQSDGDDLAGSGLVQYHVLTSQGQEFWDGATLYRLDGSYVAVSSQVIDGLVGVAQSVLPDTLNPYVTEFTRSIDVAFLTGDTSLLASATYLEVMNGANKFAIGRPGRWEVCQVIDITDNGDGTFTFEGLVRGRGTSEEFTGTHDDGDYVVWLSGSNVQHLDYSVADLDDSFNFKAVGSGGNLTTTPAVSATVTGEAEKIPKPCQLDASIDSPSDVRLSWVRRSRIGSYWPDDGDDTYTTPLGETLEQYVIRIKDGPGGAVLRTVTVNDATLYDYSGALQITDFGGALSSGDDLTYDIRQVSGTGVICPTRELTITL